MYAMISKHLAHNIIGSGGGDSNIRVITFNARGQRFESHLQHHVTFFLPIAILKRQKLRKIGKKHSVFEHNPYQ